MRAWLLLVLVLAACGGSVGSPSPSAAVPPEARAALEQVYVDGHAYTLQADLYRDLMPGPAPTPKRGVGGSIFLRPDVQSDPPQGMRADKIWLLNGAESWETVPQPLQRVPPAGRTPLPSGGPEGRPGEPAAKGAAACDSARRAGRTSSSNA